MMIYKVASGLLSFISGGSTQKVSIEDIRLVQKVLSGIFLNWSMPRITQLKHRSISDIIAAKINLKQGIFISEQQGIFLFFLILLQNFIL